jgi:hypothetical protein
MSKRKSNLEVIKDFYNGNHQKIQTGWNPPDPHRAPGEIWEDSNGRKWMQKDGYKVNINEQADIIRAASKKICKNCNKDIHWAGNYLDEKMYKMTGWCYDCIILKETNLRIEGKYKQYEEKKVLMNMLSKAYDVMQEIRSQYEYLSTNDGQIQFQNYVGLKNDMVDEENWSRIDAKTVKKDLKKEFALLAKEAYRIKKRIKSIQI